MIYSFKAMPSPRLIPLFERLMKPESEKNKKSSLVKFFRDWEQKVALHETPSPKIITYSIGPLSGKISLILVPLLASEGIVVPQIAEFKTPGKSSLNNYFKTIFGAKTSFSPQELGLQLSRIGAAVFSAPQPVCSYLHKQMVKTQINIFTPSSDSLDFIARSVMLLIFLSGATGVLFDIRIGGSSFLRDYSKAIELARCLKNLCRRMNMRSSFLMVNMNQPLGNALGDSVEIRECIEVLKGRGPLDVLKLALELAAEVLFIGDSGSERTQIKKSLRKKITEGEALSKLKEIIQAQDGHLYLEDNEFPSQKSEKRIEIFSDKEGYLQKFDMKRLSFLCSNLRWRKGNQSDSARQAFEFLIFKKIGDWIKKGDLLAEIYVNRQETSNLFCYEFPKIFYLGPEPPEFQPLIIERWREKDHF